MIQLLTILIPAGLVLYGMYLVVRSFLQKEFERNLLEIKNKSIEVALPIRLQAYERMTLFLERISPNIGARSAGGIKPQLLAASIYERYLLAKY